MKSFFNFYLKIYFFLLLIFYYSSSFAAETLNLYVWFGEIPEHVILNFEKQTGIHVNYSTYDSNETLYSKLKAAKNPGYDLIEPSSYYVDRMRKEGMLEIIDRSKLTNYKNLNRYFLNPPYDPTGNYSIPYLWGITGIFINTKYFKMDQIQSWKDFWNPQFHDQLMLLDDAREVFSMSLLSLGYSADDVNPAHIKEAYQHLLALWPNIKLFNSNAMPSIPIDEDAVVGMAWNGDIYKAMQENPAIHFIFPKDGFVIWVDNFAIPKGAPHPEAAHQFLNYILQGKISAEATKTFGYATANSDSLNYLPLKLRKNPIIFPDQKILKKGQFQRDIGDSALELYNHYWEHLKLGG